MVKTRTWISFIFIIAGIGALITATNSFGGLIAFIGLVSFGLFILF